MQKAINRFWDWLFHPSVRPYFSAHPKAGIYRYPSPGSAVDEEKPPAEDYKQPYQNSRYNVRYVDAIPSQVDQEYIKTVPSYTADGKVYIKGAIRVGDQGRTGSLAWNKPDSRDFNYLLVDKANRETFRALFEQQRKEQEHNKKYRQNAHMDKVYKDVEMTNIQSFDMFTSPSFQQSRIQNQYMIEELERKTYKKGYYEVLKGQARFWKALDDSNDKKSIEQVQKSIGNIIDSTQFQLRTSKMELQIDENGKVKNIHPKV